MNVIDSIISEFNSERDKIEIPIAQVKEQLSTYGGNILIYGAGSSGIAFLYILKKIGVTPLFFIDSNEKKIGTMCEGVEVISVQSIRQRVEGDFLVIVCINTDGKRFCKSFDDALRIGGHHKVYSILHEAGCENVIDYTYFRRCFSLFSDEQYNSPSCSDVDLMIENKEGLIWTYDNLADEESKEIFEKIVRFRLLDDSIEVPTLPQENQYFEQGIYRMREDATFVDCGAYNGISLRTFLRIQNNKFESYYGFEPDEGNYYKLKDFLVTLGEISKKANIYNSALWDSKEKVRLYSLEGPGSFVTNDIGNHWVDSTTIDEVIGDKGATFIKMNIEGSEKQALRGAKRTIEKYKPQLAIAGYHKTEDLWIIPKMILEYHHDYKLYLRSYMNHLSFVYYTD